MRRRPCASLAVAVCAVGVLSGCDDFFYVCPVADEQTLAQLPERLSETGLYEQIATGELADGVLSYRPEFELWADGADKQRFVSVPAGATIDTSNMDVWRFPEGTRLWKEFSRGGARLETRLLQKIGPGDADWASLSYVWTSGGEDAVAAPTGFVDAGGTSHDVPGAGECIGCHGGRRSFVLGLSAIQLSFARSAGELDLVDLEVLGLLSDPPPEPFDIPGDETERGALGYLHANCSHCHNQDRPGADDAPCMDPDNDLDFLLPVDRLDSPQDTPAYRTAVGTRVRPGDPDGSPLIERATSRRIFYRMPPLGSERVDDEAVKLLRRWIEGLE